MVRHVHFIGIGGTGLSAIATVLKERGEIVSGSDRQASRVTEQLREAGMTVFIGHRGENVLGADLVVRSSAVPDDHVEVLMAREAGIPVMKRMDFLDQLMADQDPIAIAGTHGKTTTTAMIAWLFTSLGEDPSYVIGGVARNLQGNAHAGKGRYFVIEADEYDTMFLGLKPWIAVVTNVEHDHPDCFPTPEHFRRAFQRFVDQLKPGGTLIAGTDDLGSKDLMEYARDKGYRVLNYSLRELSATFCAVNPQPNSLGGTTFHLSIGGEVKTNPVRLQVPGLHNAANALAALAVVNELGLPLDPAISAIAKFEGTVRRFELRGEIEGIAVLDDYAHHPTEIRATLAAARMKYPNRRIWAVWQPHTYSRSRALLPEFRTAFEDADQVVVTEIYAARENPPSDGFSGQNLAVEIAENFQTEAKKVIFQPLLSDVVELLFGEVKSGDVVLVLSAGDADQISAGLIERLSNRILGKEN